MPDSNKVYIIGFMGSGKSTTGMKLASLLGWSFIDLDRKIEEHTGLSIPEIFSHQPLAHIFPIKSLTLGITYIP